MARIVHRHRLPSLGPVGGFGRLPRLGRLFLVLAAIVAAVELWPAVNAVWLGVTDILAPFSDVLPATFRNAALVAMPAAVLWARPRAPRTNPWLWKGALIVAIVQLLRYAFDPLQASLIDAAGASEAGAGSLEYALANGLGILMALASALGIWALTEGLKDAGGRVPVSVIAALALAVVVVVVALFGPTVAAAAARRVDLELVMGIASVVVNGVFLFVLALVAVRALAGVARRLEPRRAWAAGAVAGVALAAVPILSLLVTMVTSGSGDDLSVLFTGFRLLVIAGWPLFAVAVGMGMGATIDRPDLVARARRHVTGAAPRYVPASASPMPAD